MVAERGHQTASACEVTVECVCGLRPRGALIVKPRSWYRDLVGTMAAASLSVAQLKLITGEIDRRMAAERVWVTESLAGTVASSVADAPRAVEEQFLNERTAVSEASAVFETRINQTLIASMDGRIEDITSRVTAQFVSESTGMRALFAGVFEDGGP